jgi:hypothetical protein
MIKVTLNRLESNIVIYNLSIPFFLRRKYFEYDKMIVGYNFSIQNIPDSILVCPIIGYLVPLALATGTKIHVNAVDKTFYKSIMNLRSLFKRLYPALPIDSFTLIYDKMIDNLASNDSRKIGLFFSGGVDSTALLLKHFTDRPLLITIWGSDVGLHQKDVWSEIVKYVEDLSNKLGLKFAVVAFSSPINISILDSVYRLKLYGNDFWGGLSAGIFIPSLAAPIAYYYQLSQVYIASGITKKVTRPWSDTYYVYNNLGFSNCKIVCDDFALTRYEKLESIKENLQKIKEREVALKIRSCLKPAKGKLNCGYCEKCARTILEMILLELNPNELGFDVGDLSKYSNWLKVALDQGNFKLTPISAEYWSDIKDKCTKNKLLSFLSNYNFTPSKLNKKVFVNDLVVNMISTFFGFRGILAYERAKSKIMNTIRN